MSNETLKEAASKPISTAQLGMAVMSFFERFGLAFLVALLQWSRIKQKKAEDKLAVRETEDEVHEKQVAIDAKYSGKSDADVITDFINKP